LVDTVGVLAVVISLLFVGYEVRLSRSVAVNESFGTSIEHTALIRGLVIEHADIWQRGCVGSDLTTEEEVIFGNLLRTVDRFNFFRYQRAVRGITDSNPEQWVFRVARDRYMYPGFNEKWLEIETNRFGSTTGWLNDVERVYEELSSSNRQTTFDPSLCGLY